MILSFLNITIPQSKRGIFPFYRKNKISISTSKTPTASNISFTCLLGCFLFITSEEDKHRKMLLDILGGSIGKIKQKDKHNFSGIFYDDYEIFSDKKLKKYRKKLLRLDFNKLNKTTLSLKTSDYLSQITKKYKATEAKQAIIKYLELEDILQEDITLLSQADKLRLQLSELMLSGKKLLILEDFFTLLEKNKQDNNYNITKEFALKLFAPFCDQGGIIICSENKIIKQTNLPFGQFLDIDDYIETSSKQAQAI